jgi:hypothetical protein
MQQVDKADRGKQDIYENRGYTSYLDKKREKYNHNLCPEPGQYPVSDLNRLHYAHDISRQALYCHILSSSYQFTTLTIIRLHMFRHALEMPQIFSSAKLANSQSEPFLANNCVQLVQDLQLYLIYLVYGIPWFL